MIDTAAKRRSVAALLAGCCLVGVVPDAAQPAAWRQAAGWGYVGISASAPVRPDPALSPEWIVALPVSPAMSVTLPAAPEWGVRFVTTPTWEVKIP